MGFSDLFKPGWKKDADKAIEAIERNNNMMMILKIHDECGFKGKELAKIDAAFVRSLYRLGKKHPEATEYLAYIAREGESPLLRCQSAWILIERPGMQDIMKENIAKAYADPGIEYQEKPEEWITCVDDPGRILAALTYLTGKNDLKQRILSQIRDQDILMKMILSTTDEALAVDLMSCLTENEDNYIKIAEKCRYTRCVRCAVQHISKPDVLFKIILNTNDEETASTALRRFKGNKEDYKTILLKSRFKYCRQTAVWNLGGVNPDLIASVKTVNPQLAMELFDMANEEELIELADMGLTRAIVRLTEKNPKKYFEMYQALLPEAEKRKIVSFLAMQNPEKYADSYYDLLTEEAKKKVAEQLPYSELKKNPARYVPYLPDSMKRDVIDSGILSQDVLEKLAMEGYVGDAEDSRYAAVRAYCKITNMERQERLLFEKDPKTFGGRKAIMDWRRNIIRDLSFNEEIMWRVVQYEEFPYELRSIALKNVYDAEKLQQIAMGDSPLALQAAEQLPKAKQSKLRNSANPQVSAIGTSQYNRNKVSRADEETLLEIMAWEYQNSTDPGTYIKALERLQSQDALCKALSNYLCSVKRMGITKENKPWSPLGQDMLSRITDGAGLAKVCLENPRQVGKPELSRLRELIRNTDEEKKFTDAAVKSLMTISIDGWWNPASLLMNYYELPNAAHAAWRFGGPKFIQRLLNLLEAERESGKAKEIGSYLQFIYKQVPESHVMLSGQNGRRYVKHYDYVDSGCAGNNEDRREDYVLNLEN